MRMQAGIAAPRPAAPPAPEPGLISPDQDSWFEASTPQGALRLCTTGPAQLEFHAADAAITLQRCAALLDALDAWSGLDLDWRWIAAPGPRGAGEATTVCRWRPDPQADSGGLLPHHAECQLVWPWALLRRLPAPPAALATRLHWPALEVVLSVASLRLADDELQALEPGGAVLLPASLQPAWQGTLRAADEPGRAGHGAAVALDAPLAARLIGGAAVVPLAAATSDDGRIACELRVATPARLAGDRLAGWVEGETLAIGPQANLWRCATPRVPARRLASGRLMPWGAGWAFAIDHLEEGEAAPAA